LYEGNKTDQTIPDNLGKTQDLSLIVENYTFLGDISSLRKSWVDHGGYLKFALMPIVLTPMLKYATRTLKVLLICLPLKDQRSIYDASMQSLRIIQKSRRDRRFRRSPYQHPRSSIQARWVDQEWFGCPRLVRIYKNIRKR